MPSGRFSGSPAIGRDDRPLKALEETRVPNTGSHSRTTPHTMRTSVAVPASTSEQKKPSFPAKEKEGK